MQTADWFVHGGVLKQRRANTKKPEQECKIAKQNLRKANNYFGQTDCDIDAPLCHISPGHTITAHTITIVPFWLTD